MFDESHVNTSMCTNFNAKFDLKNNKIYFMYIENGYDSKILFFYESVYMLKLIRILFRIEKY